METTKRWKRPPKPKTADLPICENCGCVLKTKKDIFFWNGSLKCKECSGLKVEQITILDLVET